MSNLVNGGRTFKGKYFALGNDIVLDHSRNWTPIGSSGATDITSLDFSDETKFFRENFDGRNYSIEGLYFNDTTKNFVGLFGVVCEGSIKNITIKSNNSSIKANAQVGAVVGYLHKGTIDNCRNYANITGVKHQHGGIVGNAKDSQILNCINYGNITGIYVAGIVGYLANVTDGNYKIINCENYGTISSISEYIGGIIGRIYNTAGSVLIKGCSTSSGKIYGSAKNTSTVTVED